ncbi:MAG: hypothetical protein ND895_01025 [Pyrinomonadaceae bacterium]|nr:hypothetical protein [Pyrinomonadaceae bacterium]
MRQRLFQQTQSKRVRASGYLSLKFCLTLLVALCSFLSGCAQPQQTRIEAPPVQQPQAAQPAEPVQLPKLSSPKLLEAQEAVKRVFKDAAVIDTSRDPNFIVGDFNGDLSQDIAVVLKVASGKIAEMNEEFPAWILRDLFEPTKTGAQLRVEEQDVLLAVIHGFGANDWRDAEATQTYLLKNAVGSGMEVHAGKNILAANKGKKVPRLNGDLIREVLQGTSGYIYYSGETYGWYDPKTFKGEPERRFVHSQRVRS